MNVYINIQQYTQLYLISQSSGSGPFLDQPLAKITGSHETQDKAPAATTRNQFGQTRTLSFTSRDRSLPLPRWDYLHGSTSGKTANTR